MTNVVDFQAVDNLKVMDITPAIVPYSLVSYSPVNKQVTLNLCTDL